MFGFLKPTSPSAQTVLITGSSRGIGLATAKKFLSQGHRVVLFCRHKEHVSPLQVELEKLAPARFLLTTGDVRSVKDATRIVGETTQRFGGIDILINNAGIGLYKPLEDTSEAEWDELMAINLKGYFVFLKILLPHMRRKKGGIVINISSGLGVHSEAKYGPYSASKFGIISLTQTAADETRNDGIKVYVVMPGGVATKLHLDMHPRENPLLMMQPEYIAEKIYWLAGSHKPTGYQLPIYS